MPFVAGGVEYCPQEAPKQMTAPFPEREMRCKGSHEEPAEDKVRDPVAELAQKKMDPLDLFSCQGRNQRREERAEN